ncbi:MAG: trehalose/maltose transport system substrate-binding protein [Solirubrobacteraceae bacterium]
MVSRKRFAAALVVALAMFVVACGGSDNNSSSGGGGGAATTAGSQDTGVTKGVKKAPTVAASKNAKGNVTFCLGKDTSGNQTAAVKAFNAKFSAQGLSAKLLEFPTSADEQRNQFVQRQEAKSPECDVFFSDVIWTAEFAAQKWLLDMTDTVNERKADFIPSTLETIHFDNKYFGVPQASDAALMYYRDDKIKTFPTTWQALYTDAKSNGGIVYQGASYEGLTCDFLELAFAAGGKVLSDDGKKSAINSPQNLKALQFMVDGVKSGAAPRAVTTYMEEESRRAFESGKYAFMRNWSYAYALGNAKGSKVAHKFKVAPFPDFEGGTKAAILGGHNLVISAYSKNPTGAVKLIDYLTSPEVEKINFAKYSITPTTTATYSDPEVQKDIPFAAALLKNVQSAHARPVTPVYPQVSQAIYKNVNAALSGQESPQDALKKADASINSALATF